jgi:hypothetical protein
MRSMGVTVPVEGGREAVFPDAIGLGRDVRHRASLFDLPRQGIAVMALVRVQDLAVWKLLEKGRSRRAISDLPARAKFDLNE